MADTKITALTADTAPTTDDLIVTVDDPGGTPANRKVTIANLFKLLASLGSASQVFHGNASGSPTFGPVALGSEVSGDLPLANLAQGAALSVLGVAGSATADEASIVAASDKQVLRRSGTSVGFGAVDLTSSAAVTGILPIANIASGTPDGTKFVRDDGTLVTPAGSGTVTNTGTLTANKAIIGNGTSDVTVSAVSGVAHLASGVLTGSSVDLTSEVTGDLPYANLAQGSALSVLGVTGNSTADNASIAAASDKQVLRRSGTSVSFGAVDLTSSAAVTGVLPIANIATGTPNGSKFVRDDGVLATPSGSGKVVQVVNTQTGAVATGTTTIPLDDTIPQNTEGTEFMTLAITPTDANNKLKIEVVFSGAYSVAAWLIVGLFQDTTANALAVFMNYQQTGGGQNGSKFPHYMTAGTTSSTTFKVRAGGQTAGTVTFNGTAGGRLFGGVLASSITITEIIP